LGRSWCCGGTRTCAHHDDGATTGLALVPLVIRGNIPGQEIEYPMAIVILGGLFTSTLLNLFVVPSLYLRFGKVRNWADLVQLRS
jgi:Cu/Ag efflux pump CusA